jgi:hypothetical protein
MDDENDAGAAYLAALRQSSAQPSSPQAAGAAPARAPDALPPAETQAGDVVPPGRTDSGSADKRRSPRYKCTGSARMQEIGSTVATWATFADISMHGCYVETAVPLHVGAVLGLKLDANGFRVEATGEVRVVYPGLGMGISFTKMSDEDRGRLRELVRSISSPSVIVPALTQGSRVGPRSPSSAAPPRSEVLPAVANPGATLQAILKFFEDRHVMGREEFLRILRMSQ